MARIYRTENKNIIREILVVNINITKRQYAFKYGEEECLKNAMSNSLLQCGKYHFFVTPAKTGRVL